MSWAPSSADSRRYLAAQLQRGGSPVSLDHERVIEGRVMPETGAYGLYLSADAVNLPGARNKSSTSGVSPG